MRSNTSATTRKSDPVIRNRDLAENWNVVCGHNGASARL